LNTRKAALQRLRLLLDRHPGAGPCSLRRKTESRVALRLAQAAGGSGSGQVQALRGRMIDLAQNAARFSASVR